MTRESRRGDAEGAVVMGRFSLAWNEEVAVFSESVTCGSVEGEVKSGALHQRRLEVKMSRWARLEPPSLAVSSLKHITSFCLSGWGENDKTYCVFGKSIDCCWEPLDSPALHKYLSVCSFPQLDMCVYTNTVFPKRINQVFYATFQ